MKSIKPGRLPSMMSGIIGIFMVCVGIVWIVLTIGHSPFFALFGVFWTGIALAMTIYNFKNATGKNRYSTYDITEEGEETDPFNERFGNQPTPSPHRQLVDNKFCPFCGTPVAGNFDFCNNCGKKLP